MTVGLWYPANLVERQLGWALSTAAFHRYFRLLLNRVHLFLPQLGGGGVAPEEYGEWEPVTRELLGETFVPVFTSQLGLLSAMDEQVTALVVTTYYDLRDAWPDPSWRLAINPGLPIQAYLPVDLVEPAARDKLLLLPHRNPGIVISRLNDGDWSPWPPGGPEQALLEAARTGDGAEYLDALLSCMMTAPTLREVSEAEVSDHYLRSLRTPDGRSVGSETFPWRTTDTPHGRVVEVFTNKKLFGRAYPDSPHITTIFESLFAMLPAGCGLSVNPGGPAGLDLTSDAMPLLARWESLDPVPQPVLLGMRWAAAPDQP